MWLFYYFNFERNNDALKSKSPFMHFVEQKDKLQQKRNGIENGKTHAQF